MPRGKRKPTIDQAREWARHDVATWERRDSRYEKEQRAFFLKNPYEPKPGEELVVPNDPAFITEKAARLLGRLDHRIEIVARDPSNIERAQKIENLLRTIWEQWKRQHGRGIHGPLFYEMAKYIIQRGWVCSRLTLNTDEKSDQPVKHSLWDPATIYPYEVDGELVRVTHRYRGRISDLIEDSNLPKADTVFSLVEGSSSMATVYSQDVKYRDDWYHMVWTDYGVGADGTNQWLKPPTVRGYCPWLINFAVGTPWRATDFDEQEYIEHIGESFFTSMMGMYRQQTKMMTMLATIIATMANPPTILFLDDGGKVQANDLKMRPGARMVLPKGKLEQFRLGAGLSDITSYWQMLQDRQNKSSFSSVSYGEQVGIESGYMGESLKAGNADVMYPYVEALTQHLTQMYEKSLGLIGDYWPSQMRAFIPKAVNRPAKWAELNYRDVKEESPFVQVTFKTQSLQERLQLAGMAASLTREKIIDLHTARGVQFLDLDDPYLIEQRVQADLIKMDPKMVQAMVPVALMFTGMQLEQELYGKIHGGDIMRLLMQGSQPPQPQGPPGGMPGPGGMPAAPPTPGDFGPPPGPPGMDGSAAPPVVAQGMGPIDPQTMQVLQALQQLQMAQGGTGQGGIPPPPPMMP